MANLRIVLCQPSHPGNIGAAARAMKTMGLTELALVSPKSFPDPEATARATHALDVLEQAMVCQNVSEAIADCGFVLGTTARQRTLNWPVYSPHDAMQEIIKQQVQNEKVAILFGNERTGLENSQLLQCHGLIHIATDPSCSALNLAAAVQIIAYEFSQTQTPEQWSDNKNEANANQAELQHFFDHFEQLLQKIDFFRAHNPEHIMGKIRCLFNRSLPKKTEVALFRGILSQLSYHLNSPSRNEPNHD